MKKTCAQSGGEEMNCQLFTDVCKGLSEYAKSSLQNLKSLTYDFHDVSVIDTLQIRRRKNVKSIAVFLTLIILYILL